MSLAQGFIRAIIESPDDDGIRLIFADWLEERGDPRGEFIRLQVERARPGLDEVRRERNRLREKKLLDAHGRQWVAPLRPWVREYQFSRGFVDRVRIRCE